ncbi:MAG: alpha/beta hydrolase [Anaerolineae bacterium]|jgi:pimeloyl-ACP methyl ester carboxylesterase|nr:alpha/beta hydrolase [Anaerolineae bacterium]MBT7072122.1 alpha/beta hydrolase [Anaerolineae bacterium]MBT7326771.1 alpha/beta hydrolase [Anaerolineae bacterium]
MTQPIPYTTYNNENAPLLFAHANGYPPDCYKPLFNLLKGYKIAAMHQRPLWDDADPNEIDDWHPLSDDLLRFMDEQKMDKTIAIGHSMGGIAILRAALREPERFSHVILLDPVLFPPYFIRFYNVIHALKLAHKLHPLVPAAQRRRRIFKSREMMMRGYRKKSIFRHFSDESLEAYINGITCPAEDGSYELCYSANWEVQIYITGVWRDMELWRALPSLKPLLLIVRGAETDTFHESATRLVTKKLPSARVATIPKSTHLLPLEQPEAVRDEIKKFLA